MSSLHQIHNRIGLFNEEEGSHDLTGTPTARSVEGAGSLWIAIACFTVAAICGIAALVFR